MKTNKSIRVWVDGCFDMVHFGHANALRQAKELGDELVVGVHTDEEIVLHKGPPIFTESERLKMVRAIKWVDEVVCGAPYVTRVDVLERHHCDFCAHGNDITTTCDQKDTYEEVKRAGKYKEFQRTEGISTTDLVGRMLLATRNHHQEDANISKNGENIVSKWTKGMNYMPNTVRITQFQSGIREPLPHEKVIYVPGTFDLFHVGHVSLLEKCLELGDYVIVGLYSDKEANSIQSSNYPIMNIHERLLSVLSCRYVSNVIIGAEPVITEDLIRQFKVNFVVQGVVPDYEHEAAEEDCFFEVPRKLGLFRQIDSGSSVTTSNILKRIIENRLSYEIRNCQKITKEASILQ